VTSTDVAVPGHPVPEGPVAARARARARLVPRWLRLHLPLLGVLLVAALPRVWALASVGFNSDETVYGGQAASLAGDPSTSQFFPVFRAHPLLFQTALSVVYRLGGGDVAARLLVAALGVATVLVVFRLGRLLYGGRVGLVAALLLALMPYHVGVSRQVLLDAPMTFLATLTLLFLARFLVTRSARSLTAAGVLMGLTILTKETAVLLLGGVLTFAVLQPAVRPTLRQGAVALGATVAVAATYPLSLTLAGGSRTGQSYLAWQLFRRSNHTLLFYPQVVPVAMGLGVVAAAVAGLWFLRRSSGWREGLLLCWALVPAAFFELWPVKGYQYLLAAAPVVAVLAARALVQLPIPALVGPDRRRARVAVRVTAIAAVAVSLAVPAALLVYPQPTTTFLAGSGGLPAGRETGRWIDANVPLGARMMTIGPSMANIVRFYGHRAALGLSVSPNALGRNPSYEPIDNPDRELRQATISYVVWDAFTADRSPFFSDRLLRYVRKYHGVAVHTETITLRTSEGDLVDRPVMIVFAVTP
jgi:4-amino-4-deoxy-L-arabinose transferase-like glycosyltransferase